MFVKPIKSLTFTQRAQANVDSLLPSAQGVLQQDCFVCLTRESLPIYLFMRVQTNYTVIEKLLAALQTQNPSTIHHTVQRGVSRVQKIEWNTNTWIDYLWLPVACYIFSVILAPHNLGIRFCCLYVVQFLLCVQKSSIQINSEKVLSLQVSLFPTLKAKTDKR